jgi:hypothetical protein
MKTKIYYLLNFLFFLSVTVRSQNNLYLVDTLTGTTDNKLWKAVGIGDMNGDGYADFVVCYKNYIDLYFGNPQFSLKPAHRFNLSASSSAYAIGDVNGDGYADLMIVTVDTSNSQSLPYCEIILGGKELDTIPKWSYHPQYLWDMSMSDQIYPLGDLNGDGYNDFAIASSYNWDDGLGRVFVFRGGKTLVDTPWVVLTGQPNNIFFGRSVLGIGDYNNDGYNDFLVSIPTMGRDTDKVFLYLGGKDSIDQKPYKIYGPLTFNNLTEIKSAGDLNGDGKKDFVISANEKAFIYLGTNDPIIFDASKLGQGGYVAIGTGGDINDDGYDDFIVGNTNYINPDSIMVGVAEGFWGGKSIDISTAAFKIEGDKKWFEYSKSMDIVGDINGDGYADIFIIQPSYPDPNYPAGKLYIYSYKKIVGIISKDNNDTPSKFGLNQNYPNPFNPSTTINYSLAKAGNVKLSVYDITGSKIVTIVNENKPAGSYRVQFNGSNLPSGIYFYKLEAGQFSQIKKMILLK